MNEGCKPILLNIGYIPSEGKVQRKMKFLDNKKFKSLQIMKHKKTKVYLF